MIEQLLIAIFGVGAVFLSQRLEPTARRWAPVLGMASQPAWFYATWKAEQWGIFALSLLYTASWGMGIWNHWIRPRLKARRAAAPPPPPPRLKFRRGTTIQCEACGLSIARARRDIFSNEFVESGAWEPLAAFPLEGASMQCPRCWRAYTRRGPGAGLQLHTTEGWAG